MIDKDTIEKDLYDFKNLLNGFKLIESVWTNLLTPLR
jgi:hypothetical protein